MNKTHVYKKIILIEKELDRYCLDSKHLSLLSGISGLPVFYLVLFQLTKKKLYLKKIDAVIIRIFDVLNNGNYGVSYCNGLAGVAHMLNFLLEHKVIEDSMRSNLDFFDNILADIALKNTQSVDDADFLHGAFGVAYYLNNRLKDNPKIKNKTCQLFEKLIEIVANYVKESEKVCNLTEYTPGTHRTNLGLAHGLVSYIIIISKFLENFPQEKYALFTLKKCIECLLRFESKDKSKLSLFPGIAINQKTAEYNIPLGWCYGDQTISFGLYKASKILKDESLREKAFKLAYRNLSRDSIEKIFPTPICDAGFCHGLSSIAYVHKKWYYISGEKKFYDLYSKFISEILDFGKRNVGIAGYQKYVSNNQYEDSIGFLDGAIGVGIVLTDYLLEDNSTINWDQFFLLD